MLQRLDSRGLATVQHVTATATATATNASSAIASLATTTGLHVPAC